MNDNVKDEKNNKKPLKFSFYGAVTIFCLLPSVLLMAFTRDIEWLVLLNFAFVIYFFGFAFTLEKPFCFSKIFKILFISFFLRVLVLINSSYLINTKPFDEILKSFPLFEMNFSIFQIFILFFVCAGILFYLKGYLDNVSLIKNNEEQVLFKNNLLNTLLLFKIEYFIILITFILNVIDAYVHEKIINHDTFLALSNAISASSIIFFVTILPILILSVSILFITISYYNNDYLDNYRANFAILFSNNTAAIVTIFVLIILVIFTPKHIPVVIMLVIFLINNILFNYFKSKK